MAKQTKEKNMRYHFVFLKKDENISRGKDYFTTSLSKAVKCFENDEETKDSQFLVMYGTEIIEKPLLRSINEPVFTD